MSESEIVWGTLLPRELNRAFQSGFKWEPAAAGPQALARLVNEWWESHRKPTPTACGFPPNEAALVKILDTAFVAGIQTDEGRPVRFRLAYTDAPYPVGDQFRFASIPFASLRPFTVDEIRRLAAATDPSRMALGVSPFQQRVEDQTTLDLLIWGLLTTRDGWWGHALFLDGPVEADLSVTAVRPGELHVTVAGLSIARLSEGRVVRYDERPPGELRAWLQAAAASTAAALEVVTWQADRTYALLLRELADGMSSARHGGTILVIESRDAMQEALALLDVKYQVRYGALAQVFTSECAIGASKLTDADRRDLIAGVVGLTLVDGAVVLDPGLSVVGFGSVIRSIRPSTDEILTVGEGKSRRLRVDTFGTRHRAAFSFCEAVPRSHAVVCSQDGGVRLVKSLNGQLAVWELAALLD